MSTPPAPKNYEHLFRREVSATGAKGLIFRLVGTKGNLVEYNENINEDANQPTSTYTRKIDVKNARGVQLGLPARDQGKFKYHEIIEFKKQ